MAHKWLIYQLLTTHCWLRAITYHNGCCKPYCIDRLFLTYICINVVLSGCELDVLCEFCDCELPPVTLRRYGLWPATPNEPRSAYSVVFLRRAESLMVSAHVSLSAIIEANRYDNRQNRNEVCTWYWTRMTSSQNINPEHIIINDPASFWHWLYCFLYSLNKQARLGALSAEYSASVWLKFNFIRPITWYRSLRVIRCLLTKLQV